MFSDGRSESEISSILDSNLKQRLAFLTAGTASAVEIIPVMMKIDPAAFYSIERFTDPQTQQATALPSGAKWIKDFGGTIVSQSGDTVRATIPLGHISDLASLPMVLSMNSLAPLPAKSVKAGKKVPVAIPTESFFQQKQFGLPMWSWLTIAGGLVIIFIGMQMTKKTSAV